MATAPRATSEAALQEAVATYFATTLPPTVFPFHPMNEGKRGFQAQRAFKRGGGVAGLPDWGIIHLGKTHWIELKSEAGRVRPEQRACHAALAAAGCPVAIARSLDDVRSAIASWGIPTRDAAARVAA